MARLVRSSVSDVERLAMSDVSESSDFTSGSSSSACVSRRALHHAGEFVGVECFGVGFDQHAVFLLSVRV